MPTFGAANLRRLPPLSANDVDVYKLAISVSELSKQVCDLQATVQALLGNQQQHEVSVSPVTTANNMDTNKAAEDKEVASAAPAFADLFLMKDANGEWFPVSPRKQP